MTPRVDGHIEGHAAAGDGGAASGGCAAAGDHSVEFYKDNAGLIDAVVDHLIPGLLAGGSGIVVATSDHREAICANLEEVGLLPVDADRLVMLDARETLQRFMSGDLPDPERFNEVVGGIVRNAGSGQPDTRVFGEMVALLWADGNVAAAMALEDLWNRLRETCSFQLLCGYPTSSFDDGNAELFQTVCDLHGQVSDEGHTRLRRLEAELARSRDSERRQARFAAMVAHDLRSPSAAQVALLDLLRSTWPRLAAEEIDQMLAMAAGTARRIERLVEDLRVVPQVEAGTYQFAPRPVDLVAVARSAIEEVAHATDRSIELVCHTPVGDLTPLQGARRCTRRSRAAGALRPQLRRRADRGRRPPAVRSLGTGLRRLWSPIPLRRFPGLPLGRGEVGLTPHRAELPTAHTHEPAALQNM
jgi:signal transduction histidine kinase